MRLSSRIATLMLAVGLLGACTAAEPGSQDAATCSDLVDLAVTIVADARDSAASLESKDLEGAVTGDAEEVMLTLLDSMAPISARSSELGCDPDEWNAEYQQRVLELPPLTLGGLFVVSVAVSSTVDPF